MAAGLLLLLPLVLFLTLGAVVVLVLALTARPAHTLPAEVASARRHSMLTSVAAGIAFVGTVGFLTWHAALRPSPGPVPPTPFWLGALPLIGATVALPVLALGELTWPRPRDNRRVANLNPRTIRDLVPRGWAVVTSGVVLVAVVVILTGWSAADGSGRSITALDLGDGRSSSTSGPFPGSFYVLPQLVALTVTAALLYVVLRLVVHRPAVVRSDVATDNRLRTASVVRALRVVAAATALTCAGDLFFGGAAAANTYDTGWQNTVGQVVMLLGAAFGCAAAGLLLAPAPRLPRADEAAPEQSLTTSS
jgi:hypothetical protein